MRVFTSRPVSTLLLLLLLSVFGERAHAGGPVLEPGETCLHSPVGAQAPHVTIRMYDYALAPTAIVERAEQVAQRIFRETGIETKWLNCKISEDDPRANDAGCGETVTSADVTLRLLPDEMAKAAGTRASIYGFAMPLA